MIGGADTDIDRPSTWIPYRTGLCEGCFAGCCQLPVEVNAQDLVTMGLADADDLTGSLKKLAKRLIEAKIVHHFRAASGLFTLAQKGNRDCIFLDNFRRCRIYEKRPTVCRNFPAVGPRSGFCPRQDR
jgi:Fe-S-cluster containining protein